WRSGTRAVVGAGILAGLALLCKQSFVAALVAGGLWLFLERPKSTAAFLFVGSAGLTFAIPCLVLQATTRAFVQNTVEANVNPFYLSVAAGLLSAYVRAQWLPLL